MASNGYVSDRRLYLDKDGKVVGEKDPNRVSLLIAAGGTVPQERAEELGLVGEGSEELLAGLAEGDGGEDSGEESGEDSASKGAKKPSKKSSRK